MSRRTERIRNLMNIKCLSFFMGTISRISVRMGVEAFGAVGGCLPLDCKGPPLFRGKLGGDAQSLNTESATGASQRSLTRASSRCRQREAAGSTRVVPVFPTGCDAWAIHWLTPSASALGMSASDAT